MDTVRLELPDFLTPEQVEINRLRRMIYEQGMEWRVTERKTGDIYTCSGFMIKRDDDGDEIRTNTVMGMVNPTGNKVQGMARAEIAAIILALDEFGVTVELGEPEFNPEIEFPTRDQILACRKVGSPDRLVEGEVYTLLRPFKDAFNLLKEENAKWVQNGQRASVLKVADLFYPVRKAERVITRRGTARPSGEVSDLMKRFEEKGISELNYSQKIPADIREKYSSLLLLCTFADTTTIDGIFT